MSSTLIDLLAAGFSAQHAAAPESSQPRVAPLPCGHSGKSSLPAPNHSAEVWFQFLLTKNGTEAAAHAHV